MGSASGGGISGNPTASEGASLALDPAGRPVVAWHDAGMRRLMVAAWNGTAWVELGAGAEAPDGGTDAVSCWPSLACGVTGTPTLAWVEEAQTLAFRVYVRRWNGTAWVEIGNASARGDGVSGPSGWGLYPALTLDAAGQPVVAWQDDSTGAEEVRVRRWDGVSWSEVGPGSASGAGLSATPAGRSRRPAIVSGPGGCLVVAWVDDASGRPEVYLRQWSGNAWVELGGSASGGGVSATASARPETRPALVLDAAGYPLVAWADGALGAGRILARRWNGMAWVEIGPGSASGGGIGGPAGDAHAVTMALAADGNPVVAWEAEPTAPARIYVRQWDGTAWREAGAGSDSGSGVSLSSLPCRRPALAVDPVSGLAAIAWDGVLEPPNTEIYLRCLAVPEPVTHTVTFDLGLHATHSGGGELVQPVAHGAAALAPEFIVTPGWVFTGWSADFAAVTTDLVVRARFAAEAQTWTVAFELGGQGTHAGGGPLLQHVAPGDAAVAPAVAVAPGWVFAGWDADFGSVATDLVVRALYRAAAPVLPVGGFRGLIPPEAAAGGLRWWNLTGEYAALVAGRPLTLSLVHDCQGRLSGTATYHAGGQTPVAMPIRGRVQGAAGSLTTRMILRGSDRDRTVAVALRLTLALNTLDRTLRGPLAGSLRTGGVTAAVSEALVLDLPSDMDGTWTLELDLAQPRNTITGTGLLTLANGVCHALAARGTATPHPMAVLNLAGGHGDPASGAIRIRTTVTPLEDGWARIGRVSARGYGQAVSW